MDIERLLRLAVEKGGSDVFLKVDAPPAVRIHGQVIKVETDPLTPEDMKEILDRILNEDQMAAFERKHELDLAFAIPDVARFRTNLFQQRGTIAIVFRVIQLGIKSIRELNLPVVLETFCKTKQGLVLVTGPTGSGKSTTLAAMIDLINRTRRCHIITVEDPIEYVHPDHLSIVNQRELGFDTDSFHDALRAVVRESPDVILIGELRDVETMTVCLQAAETGHLVFSTVHTTSASETMERIINMFPPHDKPQMCLRLSKSIKGIISQKLVGRVDGKGRLCALEVMVTTPTIAQYIEEGRSGQIYSAIVQDGREKHWGMQSMNQSLDGYYKAGAISEQVALENAGNLTELKQMIRRQDSGAPDLLGAAAAANQEDQE